MENLRNMASIYLMCDNKMLLLYRQGSRVVNDVWIGSAGGHFETNELNHPKACVLREMEEEIGVRENQLQNLELRYITLKRTKGEIRQNYYFFAELINGTSMDLVSDEGILQWFPLEELRLLEMPFTSKYVIKHYLDIGRLNHQLYSGIADGEKLRILELPEC